MNLQKLMDICERALAILLFTAFAMSIIPHLRVQSADIFLLASESLTVFFMTFRKPGPAATNAYPVAIGLIGTVFPLLVRPGGVGLAPLWLGSILLGFGFLVAISGKLFLNNSFGLIPANRGVKRRGPYRLVRHPIYAGYIINQIGFLLLNGTIWNASVYGLAWLLLFLRIIEEERFLSRDEAYSEYMRGVRYRLVPLII